jgi:hypothetical protein
LSDRLLTARELDPGASVTDSAPDLSVTRCDYCAIAAEYTTNQHPGFNGSPEASQLWAERHGSITDRERAFVAAVARELGRARYDVLHCKRCHGWFVAGRRHDAVFCSNACRQAAYRARKAIA